MSGEDFWPRWLSKWVRREYGTKKFSHTQILASGEKDTEAGQRLNLQIPAVCIACNNTWMSRAEDAVKPVLISLIDSPKSHQLGLQERESIAMWMAIKSVVLDHFTIMQGARSKPFFTPQQRTHMRTSEQPPSRIDVYIGRIKRPPTRTNGSFRTLYYSKLTPKTAKHLRAFVVTISINDVILQLVASQMVRPIPLVPIEFGYRVYGYKWSAFALQIWPDLGDTFWPPPRTLLSFNTLAYRLGVRPGDPFLS